MTNVSKEYALILNLRNTANNHKEHCHTNCNVSLVQLKQAAQLIRGQMVNQDELNTKELLMDWPV